MQRSRILLRRIQFTNLANCHLSIREYFAVTFRDFVSDGVLLFACLRGELLPNLGRWKLNTTKRRAPLVASQAKTAAGALGALSYRRAAADASV